MREHNKNGEREEEMEGMCGRGREGYGNLVHVPFFDFCFDFPSFPLTSCSRFSSSAFFLAVSAAGLLDFCTVGKKNDKHETGAICIYKTVVLA